MTSEENAHNAQKSIELLKDAILGEFLALPLSSGAIRKQLNLKSFLSEEDAKKVVLLIVGFLEKENKLKKRGDDLWERVS